MSEINDYDNGEETQEEQDDGKMSLVDHLQELRKRIITSLIAILVSSSVCYYYAETLLHYIMAPVGKLYYMNPTEIFFSQLKISFFAGFLVVLPIVMYQLWAFVLPALNAKERKAMIILVPSSVLLFFVGLAFSYFLVLPAGVKFFMGFASDELQPMFSVGQYLSFVISFLLPFGFIFELPLFMIILAKIGILGSRFLTDKRKHVLVLSFVVGAVIAPTPDVFSQAMVAIPIIIMYEISLFIIKHILRK